MKKITALITVAVALVLFAPVSGCKTSGKNQTFNTLFSTGHSVDAAYSSYVDLVVAGSVKTNGLPRVSRAYKDFQEVFKYAVLAMPNDTNAAPSKQVLDSASIVIATINAEKGK